MSTNNGLPFPTDLLEYGSYFIEFCVKYDWFPVTVPSVTSE